jgi:uncharacterized membrane protein YgdD (TMEM256/DUF423 family)
MDPFKAFRATAPQLLNRVASTAMPVVQRLRRVYKNRGFATQAGPAGLLAETPFAGCTKRPGHAIGSGTKSSGPELRPMQRFLILAAGLLGAAGVGLLAAAAHIGGDNLRTAAAFILAHAPALLAIGLAGRNQAIAAAACVMLAGVALFSGDLVMRDMFGERLFAMAAPTGGTLTMLGWLGVALSVLLPAARRG